MQPRRCRERGHGRPSQAQRLPEGVSYYQKGLYHYQKGVGYYQEGIDAYLKILNGFFDNKAARTGNSNQIPKHSIVG